LADDVTGGWSGTEAATSTPNGYSLLHPNPSSSAAREGFMHVGFAFLTRALDVEPVTLPVLNHASDVIPLTDAVTTSGYTFDTYVSR